MEKKVIWLRDNLDNNLDGVFIVPKHIDDKCIQNVINKVKQNYYDNDLDCELLGMIIEAIKKLGWEFYDVWQNNETAYY